MSKSSPARGDTAAALDIAKNPTEAFQAVAKGQGNAAFVDMYLEGAESVIGDMLIHTFKAGADDTFAPTVGNITKSKLAGQSFVAPMSMGLSKAEATEMAKVFSEVFEAMARTADPAQLNRFFRNASKLANWWKAQAVGTPGVAVAYSGGLEAISDGVTAENLGFSTLNWSSVVSSVAAYAGDFIGVSNVLIPAVPS